ncbi:MAG TPA: hypothetical protein VER36_09655 [Flavisolibacter sp.]|nr:hypothetical protein [Flavisolibacter sp.]
MTKLASALEGGLAGVTTISLLTETLRKINGNSSHLGLLDGGSLKKRFKKVRSKKRGKATKQFIRLAGDLLGSTAFLGLSSLGKKKNSMLRGGLLGTAAGLGSVLMNGHDKQNGKSNGHEGYPATMLQKDQVLSKVLEVSLYTIGGLIAGKVIQGTSKKKKRRKK